MAARKPPPAASLADLNARLWDEKQTVREHLLELKLGQQAHKVAISSIQDDMHKLVQIAEKQIELQGETKQQSSAMDRAFKEMKENREELLKAVRDAAQAFADWRTAHERENDATALIVNSHQTGVRIIWVVFGLVAMSSVAWLFVQFQRVDESIAAGDAIHKQTLDIHQRAYADDKRRLETRVERLEYGNPKERR